MEPLLRLNGVCLDVPTGHVIRRRKRILHGVSFAVEAGKITAYLGPNGAGKTSTFRVLCGLCRASGGSITFGGEMMTCGLPAQRFGFMPEQPYFYRHLTTRELLTALARLAGVEARQIEARIGTWAERLNFSHVIDQPLRTCSKGQLQRIGLAQALLHEPELLLLDEPMSGLDPLGRECVRRVIAEENARGTTILFSSHILADVEQLCTAAVVLHQGKVVYAGDISGLVEHQAGWTIRFHGKPPAKIAEGIMLRQMPDGSWLASGTVPDSRDALIGAILTAPDSHLLSVQPLRRSLEEAFVELLANAGAEE